MSFKQLKEQNPLLKEFDYDFEIHSKPTNIILGLTNQCQLNCNYCFVKQNPKTMTLNIAEDALKWGQKNGEHITVTFFGGEPLLCFDSIIKPLVEKYNDQFSWNITTNGIMLSEDIIDFFYKYNICTLLSFDGVPEVQNTQRSNSFDQILKNIPYLLLRFPNTTMRATVTKDSLPYLYETVLMAEELGFSSIFFGENAYENWGEKEAQIIKKEFEKICLYIYKKLMNKEIPIKVDPIIRYFQNDNNICFDNRILRCGLGTTSCGITPTGKIVSCQEKISTELNVIGDIYNGISPILHKQYLLKYYNQINSINCEKQCCPHNQILCMNNFCPSRLEDLNFQISTSSCVWLSTINSIVDKLKYLCKCSNKTWIRNYFGEDEEN